MLFYTVNRQLFNVNQKEFSVTFTGMADSFGSLMMRIHAISFMMGYTGSISCQRLPKLTDEGRLWWLLW